MNSQLEKLEESKVQDSASSFTHNINYNDAKDHQHNQPSRSTRQKFTYQSFQEESKCVICTAVKKDAHEKLVPVQMMTFREIHDFLHLAEKQLEEFAQIDGESCSKFPIPDSCSKFQIPDSGLCWIAQLLLLFLLLMLYTKSLVTKSLVTTYLELHRGKKLDFKKYIVLKEISDELVDVIEYWVVLKREVYTLRQLREICTNIAPSLNVWYLQMPMFRLMQLKRHSYWRRCHHLYETKSHITFNIIRFSRSGKNTLPSNFQGHTWINEFSDLDKLLFNLIAWIVSPNAAMGKDGFVVLSYRKATKISEIVQNIQSLVPGAQPGFDHILLSITMLAKTGSQMVVDNLKQLVHGFSNTEAVFIQDKWAEWTERLKSIYCTKNEVSH